MSDFIKTEQYFQSMYLINNPQGRVLRLGDLVLVHPTKTSIMRESYPGMIGKMFWNIVGSPCFEITMYSINGYPYKALMNDYCFKRLEPIKWYYNKNYYKQAKKIYAKDSDICFVLQQAAL